MSRYKVSRSQKTVTVQDFNYGQMRVSGYKFRQDLSWEHGFAKTMTSPLIIPSVLVQVEIFFLIVDLILQMLVFRQLVLGEKPF